MNTYKRHRFPSDVISYAVWLYYKFNLSHRDVEDLLAGGAFPSAMRRSDCSVLNLAQNMPIGSRENIRDMASG